MPNYTGKERRGTLNGIERSTFAGMEVEDKLAVLFDYHVSMHNMLYRLMSEHCPQQEKECDKRFKKIEQGKLYHTMASGIGGILGGFIAIVAKWLMVDR